MADRPRWLDPRALGIAPPAAPAPTPPRGVRRAIDRALVRVSPAELLVAFGGVPVGLDPPPTEESMKSPSGAATPPPAPAAAPTGGALSFEAVAAAVQKALARDIEAERATVDRIIEAARAYGAVVERSRVARFLAHNGLESSDPTGAAEREGAATRLLDLVGALPELSAASAPAAPPEPAAATAQPTPAWLQRAQVIAAQALPQDAERDEPDAEEAAPVAEVGWPRLRALALARKHGVVLIGGIPILEREQWGRAHVGRFAWIELYRERDGGYQALLAQLRRGELAAVLIVQGWIPHRQSGALMDAARESGTPFALVGKGGKPRLRQAFSDVEARIVPEGVARARSVG